MLESQGEPSYDFKAQTSPEFHGAFVRADNEIELHGAVARLPRPFFGVQTHCSGNAMACGMSRCDISTVADVRAAATLVGAKIVGADNIAISLSHEDLIAACKPIGESLSPI